MNEEISLYTFDSPLLKVNICLRFEGETLVLDGYDCGVTTKQLTGDFDYEYRIMVSEDALPALYSWLNEAPGQKQILLQSVAAKISGEKAHTLFRNMLTEAAVAFETWSY